MTQNLDLLVGQADPGAGLKVRNRPGWPKHCFHYSICRTSFQALVKRFEVAQEHLLCTFHGTLLPPRRCQEIVDELEHGFQTPIACVEPKLGQPYTIVARIKGAGVEG